MKKMAIPILVIIGVLCIVTAAFIATKKDAQNKKAAESVKPNEAHPQEYDMERTETWTEIEFLKMADSVFSIINTKTYSSPKNKYWLRYIPDIGNKKQIVHEMYDKTIIWEWKYDIYPYKAMNIDRLSSLQDALIYEALTANSVLIERAFEDKNDKQFHERIEKLNPKK